MAKTVVVLVTVMELFKIVRVWMVSDGDGMKRYGEGSIRSEWCNERW